MTVHDLIARLQNFDLDREVNLQCEVGSNRSSSVCKDGKLSLFVNKETKELVVRIWGDEDEEVEEED
jgi:hypothetical protein